MKKLIVAMAVVLVAGNLGYALELTLPGCSFTMPKARGLTEQIDAFGVTVATYFPPILTLEKIMKALETSPLKFYEKLEIGLAKPELAKWDRIDPVVVIAMLEGFLDNPNEPILTRIRTIEDVTDVHIKALQDMGFTDIAVIGPREVEGNLTPRAFVLGAAQKIAKTPWIASKSEQGYYFYRELRTLDPDKLREELKNAIRRLRHSQ